MRSSCSVCPSGCDAGVSAADAFAFVLELSLAARGSSPATVLASACSGLARLLDARVSGFVPSDGPGLELVALSGELAPHAEVAAQGTVPAQRHQPPDPLPAFEAPLGSGGLLIVDGPNADFLTDTQQRLVVSTAALVGQLMDDARSARQHEEQLVTVSAIRQLLETGVRAVSRPEVALAVARTTAAVLGVSTACTYLVGDDGLISELATFGADPDRDARLRQRLVGAPASGSPVWRRAAAGTQPGPDLIDDTSRQGAVRPGGVAEVLGLRSMATIPLLSSDGPLGLVLCGDTAHPRRWGPNDRRLLEELALQATVVVDNARLREIERHEARNDALTGLANRRAFGDELQVAVAAAAASGRRLAMLQIDLDGFKAVNDQFGHHEGDRLLIMVGDRIRSCLQGSALVARLGGDEFAVLLTDDPPPGTAEALAARIGTALEDPVELAGTWLPTEASIGIACFPDHATDGELLKQRADRAMYAAKRTGVGALVYRPEHESAGTVDPRMLGELRRALSGNELVLLYQPKLDLRTLRVTGAEALVRWQHPRLGLLGPDRFVPLAEQSGRIRSLTSWVVPHALEQARRWQDDSFDVSVAVNVSARDVADPSFVAKVGSWLAEAGVPGHRLTIELTEGTLMGDRETASRVLASLRATGVRISVDDFGTGYSSLAYLQSLPIDELKIDRSFLGHGERGQAVIRSIIALGAGLGLTTVAEGVEDEQTASMLAALGCDLAQGYHFGRPMTDEQLVSMLRRA